MATDWKTYVDAGRRKISIASFHTQELKRRLAEGVYPEDGRPPIAVQACFEGVVIAAIAAIDQVAQAANSALGLGLSSSNLFDGAAQELSARIQNFEAWRRDPIGIDLRRVRTRMVHYSYEKKGSRLVWEVEIGSETYRGSRELGAYADAATAYLEKLRHMLGPIEVALSKA